MEKKKRSVYALGETEMEVLRHVWELGEATVAQVHEKVSANRKAAYTTIMTVMKNLMEKGYLEFRQQGHSYVYTATQPAAQVQHSMLRNLITQVFGGSPMEAIQTLVRNEDLTEAELEQLRQLLKQGRKND